MDELHHLALPVIVLSLGSWSVLMRYTRTSVLEVLSADYVNTAKSKGLKWPIVVRRHALRNALLPLITIIALSVPGIIGGSVLVETVFDWPGMGQASVLAIGRRDYPLMMGVMVVFSIAVLLSNLIADIAYAFADPRIRLPMTARTTTPRSWPADRSARSRHPPVAAFADWFSGACSGTASPSSP